MQATTDYHESPADPVTAMKSTLKKNKDKEVDVERGDRKEDGDV
jgi:hypothetical protein